MNNISRMWTPPEHRKAVLDDLFDGLYETQHKADKVAGRDTRSRMIYDTFESFLEVEEELWGSEFRIRSREVIKPNTDGSEGETPLQASLGAIVVRGAFAGFKVLHDNGHRSEDQIGLRLSNATLRMPVADEDDARADILFGDVEVPLVSARSIVYQYNDMV